MLDAHASPYIYAPAHIYAAPYVHAETHIDAASHIDANRCDRSGNTVHTNRSALSTWLDSRSVLCAGWHVDTDPKADSDQHANGQAYVNANLHAYAGWRKAAQRRQFRRTDPYANANADTPEKRRAGPSAPGWQHIRQCVQGERSFTQRPDC